MVREKVKFTGRSYTNLDFDVLKEHLLLFDWNNFADNDIYGSWYILFNRMTTVVNKLCPMKDFKFAKER